MKIKRRDAQDRILALDIRARRIGYAAFESPTRLFDFGMTRFKSSQIALGRLARIVYRVAPARLILRKMSPSSPRNTRRTRAAFRLVFLYAKRHGVGTATIRAEQIKHFFESAGTATKYEIAKSIGKQFPELEWRLPLPRKAWKPEHPNMSIFDAAALGMTYFGKARNG